VRPARRTAAALLVLGLAGGCTGDAPPAASRTFDPTTATPTAPPTPTVDPSPTATTRVPSPPTSASPTRAGTDFATRPPRYRDVPSLVADLVRAERAIRGGRATPDLAHRQQRAYRQLVQTPAWREPALARIPADLRTPVEANLRAGAELYTFTRPQTRLPPWQIVPAPPAAELRGYYDEAERRTGVDWTYLAAIHLVETRMGRLRGTSTAGAQGPMQFLPSTWAEPGVGQGGDIHDPRDAIHAAARYLVKRGRGDIRRGVRGYNPSDHYVEAVLAYASVLQAEPRAYDGYYHWQVYYRLASGDRVLEEGYRGPARD
jgi:hypothetical protein